MTEETKRSVCSDCELKSRSITWLFGQLFDREDAYSAIYSHCQSLQTKSDDKAKQVAGETEKRFGDLLFRAVAGVPYPEQVSDEGLRHLVAIVEQNPCIVELAEKLKAVTEGIKGLNDEIEMLQRIRQAKSDEIAVLEQKQADAEKTIESLHDQVQSWQDECSRLSGNERPKLLSPEQWKEQHSAEFASRLKSEADSFEYWRKEYEDVYRSLQDANANIKSIKAENKALRDLLPEGSNAFESFLVGAIVDGEVNKAKAKVSNEG